MVLVVDFTSTDGAGRKGFFHNFRWSEFIVLPCRVDCRVFVTPRWTDVSTMLSLKLLSDLFSH